MVNKSPEPLLSLKATLVHIAEHYVIHPDRTEYGFCGKGVVKDHWKFSNETLWNLENFIKRKKAEEEGRLRYLYFCPACKNSKELQMALLRYYGK
jgi:hypothetical protein